jgi:hypothetical protein
VRINASEGSRSELIALGAVCCGSIAASNPTPQHAARKPREGKKRAAGNGVLITGVCWRWANLGLAWPPVRELTLGRAGPDAHELPAP